MVQEPPKTASNRGTGAQPEPLSARNCQARATLPLWILAAAVVVYFSYCIALATTRAPWYDEGVFVSVSRCLITTGYLGDPIRDDSGPFIPSKTQVSIRGLREHMYFEMPVYNLSLVAWMKVFGFGLLTSRLFDVFCGAVVLLLWCYIVRCLVGDMTVAVVTLALIAGDYGFIIRASEVRPDILSALFGFGGLAVYLYSRNRSFSWAVFLSNLCVSASAFTHPNGGIVAGAGLVFLTLYYDWRNIRFRHVAIALTPYLIGAGGWAWYIAKDVEGFRSQFLSTMTQEGRMDTFGSPLTTLKREIQIRYLHTLGGMGTATVLSRLKLLIVIAYFCGVVGVLTTRSLRQQKGYRVLLFLTGIYFLVLAFTDGRKSFCYTVHVIPLYAALVATLLVWLWRNQGPAVRVILATIMIGLFVIHLSGIADEVRRDAYHNDYLPAISFMKRNVHSDQLLMGPGVLGFGLAFPANLIDDFRLGALSGKTPDWIAVDSRYVRWSHALKFSEPTAYKFVRNRIEHEYTPVYEHGSYTIYRRNPSPASAKHETLTSRNYGG
jgi:hypothetical protein